MRTTLFVDGEWKDIPDYATVQGILIGVVAAFVLPLMAYIPMRLSHREWSHACTRRIN